MCVGSLSTWREAARSSIGHRAFRLLGPAVQQQPLFDPGEDDTPGPAPLPPQAPAGLRLDHGFLSGQEEAELLAQIQGAGSDRGPLQGLDGAAPGRLLRR